MNIQVGKSAGIALLLAAALLAALFAMGVFAPAGVKAGVYGGDRAPTVTLLDKNGSPVTHSTTAANLVDGTLAVEFTVSDTVDGMAPDGTFTSDSVKITVPASLFATTGSGVDTDMITVMQGTQKVGKVTAVVAPDPAGDDTLPPQYTVTITIAAAEDGSGRTDLLKDTRVKVTLPKVDFNSIPFGGTVEVRQPESASASAMAKVNIFNSGTTVTAAEADLVLAEAGGALTLVVKFKARAAHTTKSDIVITLPAGTTATPADATGDNATPDDDTDTNSALDGNSAADDPVVGYIKDETVTVTFSTLVGFNLNGGQVVKLAEGSYYTANLVIGGDAVDGPDDTGTGPTRTMEEAVLGKGGNLADAATSVTLSGTAKDNAIMGATNIIVSLPGFHIPDDISEEEVIINGNLLPDRDSGTPENQAENDDYYGHPASIAIDGSKITLSMPARMPSNTGSGTVSFQIQQTGATNTPSTPAESTAVADDGRYTIFFKQGAGLRNPNSAGTKTITVQDADPAVDGKHPETKVKIDAHIKAKPVWVSRGDAITVTGKGINSTGTVTLHLYEGDEDAADLMGGDLTGSLVLGSARMDDGTAIVEFDATSSRLMAEATPATATTSAGATNTIVMVDAGGNVVGHTNVGIMPTVKLDVSEVRRSGKMKVSVSDWYYGDIADIRVNGIQVNLPDGTDADDIAEDWEEQSVPSNMKLDDLEVIVDRTVRLGEMEVVVYGSTYKMQGTQGSQDKHTQTVDVGVFDLSVSPSTAVTDQVIRLEGTGFLPRACITSIMVGEQAISEATTGDDVGSDERDCVDTDSNGKLADSFHVPFGLKPGTYRLVVRDEGNRVGEANLTVPKPMIELNPDVGQRGDTVVVEGKNFPAEDLVTVRYRGVAVASGTTDTIGQFRANFTVPITAPIGATHEVLAKSENKGDGSTVDGVTRANLSATADHMVPDETLELSPETVAAGGRLTVTGGNLPLFTPVTVRIGGIAAAGRAIGEDDASDGTGRYERVILVPQLTPGTHTVELTAHARNEDISVARFVVIADIVTRPTEEVFADMIAAGQLEVVWKYDNASQSWSAYDPNLPSEINDLNLVSTNDIVWVSATADVEFQGGNLFTGWNLITLE